MAFKVQCFMNLWCIEFCVKLALKRWGLTQNYETMTLQNFVSQLIIVKGSCK